MQAAVSGHLYTVGRHLLDRLRPPALAVGDAWRAMVVDPALGPLELQGVIHVPARQGRSKRAVVLVHGLGGSIESGYMRRTAAAALARGLVVLRLNLRGADRCGADIYHAGLTADLDAAVADLRQRGFDQIAGIGFSLGGSTLLRAAGTTQRSLVAAVAVCSPLDLSEGSRHIDAPPQLVYRRYLLDGLKDIYRRAAPRIARLVGTSAEQASSIRRIRDWDERIVAARFGFDGAEAYYQEASALGVLGQVRCPMLMIRAERDPMISDVAAALGEVEPIERAEIWKYPRAGHVGFSLRLAVEDRILDWLAEKWDESSQ